MPSMSAGLNGLVKTTITITKAQFWQLVGLAVAMKELDQQENALAEKCGVNSGP
jgi:hypothetical protein